MRNGCGNRLLKTASKPDALPSSAYSLTFGSQVVLVGFPPFGGHSHFERTSESPSTCSFHSSSTLAADLGMCTQSSTDAGKPCEFLLKSSGLSSACLTASSYARNTVDLPALLGPTRQTISSSAIVSPSLPMHPMFRICMRTRCDLSAMWLPLHSIARDHLFRVRDSTLAKNAATKDRLVRSSFRRLSDRSFRSQQISPPSSHLCESAS